MKPQILSSDVGRHNQDLAQSTRRVKASAAWKKQRIVMIMPASNSISTRVYLSHMSLAFPPNNMVHREIAVGLEVGEAYSSIIEGIVNHPILSEWEYILTLEHDNMPPYDGVLKLLAQMEKHPEYACIGGLYWTKGEAGVPQIWGDPKDPVLNFRPQPPQPGKLVECCGTGMGFNLWRMSLFKDKKLRRPWFKTLKGEDGKGMATQDLYAWADFRKHGHRCAIDCSVLVGHYDAVTDIVW
jgi:hypothetical protein